MSGGDYRDGLRKILKAKYNSKSYGIYEIRCIENDNFYIGSTNNFERRFTTHKFQLKHKKHSNYRLQIDFDKFGEDKFVFKELLKVSHRVNRDKLYDLEQEHIDRLKPTYNIQLIVERTKFKKIKSGVKAIKRLKEGVTGAELKGRFKKSNHRKKDKKVKNKGINHQKSNKPPHKYKIKVRKESYLKELNKVNDAVNARRKELGR
jgi:group I intron endonuclease